MIGPPVDRSGKQWVKVVKPGSRHG
jgi:hypothetical protein